MSVVIQLKQQPMLGGKITIIFGELSALIKGQ